MPFSALYGQLAKFRKILFEKGVRRSFALGAPAISVGNITVGGTGKTPFVAYLAEFLASEGERVCILSRGYKRDNPTSNVTVSDGDKILTDVRNAGDEPLELAKRLIGKASVIVDADRVRAAGAALKSLTPTVFVLDDAFQHFRAERDLDIVLIDATNPLGNRKTLPFGILREPLAGLSRAGLILISRSNLVSKDILESIVADLRVYADCAIIASRNEFSGFSELDTGKRVERGGSKYLAFCAIGNPSNFFEQLRNESVAIVGTKQFHDHHFYSEFDVAAIAEAARSMGADALVTTAKDAVKLANLAFPLPCCVAENKLCFDDELALIGIVRETLRAAKSKITNHQ